MSEENRKLELIATISSLISFFWIGILDAIHDFLAGGTFSYTLFFLRLLGYLVFTISVAYLLLKREIKVEYHRMISIKNTDEKNSRSILLEGRESVEVFSSELHFKILITAAFYGPELNKIRKYFAETDVRVYTLVSEVSRFYSRDLLWLQKNEYGILGPQGEYETGAYLGGTADADYAKDRETFAVYLFIPKDKKYRFEDVAVYKHKELPKALYITPRPLYVITRRKNYQKEKTIKMSPSHGC